MKSYSGSSEESSTERIEMSESDRKYFANKAGIIEGNKIREMVDELRIFDGQTYDGIHDVLYLTTKARHLIYKNKRANIDAYSERVSEVVKSLNPDLDTRQYFKDYCVKQYNEHIAGSAEECLSIAFSLCGKYPYSCSTKTSIGELMGLLAFTIVIENGLSKDLSILSEIVGALGINQETIQVITQIRYELFCLK